jgi:hypothetical protein
MAKDPTMPGVTEDEIRDKIRAKLSRMEDEILLTLDSFKEGIDPRWLAIGRTNIQLGFMAVKRAVYEGKRVGD